MEENDNTYKVRLTSSMTTDRLADRQRTVIFDVTPDLIENRNINYKTIDPLHSPGQIYVYSGTNSRTFNLSSIKLISRTPEEASKNLKTLWKLRSWCLPAFGQSSYVDGRQQALAEARRNNPQAAQSDLTRMLDDINNSTSQRDVLGSPPHVLLLSAYTKTSQVSGLGHIRRVPVVIQQLSIPYPSDVDYIPTDDPNPVPMPTIMTLDIILNETHSPSEYEQFSLDDFRIGNLQGF